VLLFSLLYFWHTFVPYIYWIQENEKSEQFAVLLTWSYSDSVINQCLVWQGNWCHFHITRLTSLLHKATFAADVNTVIHAMLTHVGFRVHVKIASRIASYRRSACQLSSANSPVESGITKYRKGPTKDHYTRPQRIRNHEKTARLAKILCIFSFELFYLYFCKIVNFRVLMRLNDLWRFRQSCFNVSYKTRQCITHQFKQ